MAPDLFNQKFDRAFQAGILVGALGMAFLLAAIWPASAQAGIFPPWPTVTPQTILQPISEFTWAGSIGSVLPKQTIEKADGCPVIENGKVVGWSLNCFPSASRGGIRERL